MFIELSSWLKVIARVHSVHLMNVGRRQMAPTLRLGPWVRLYTAAIRHTHRRHLLLLSQKADTHFTVPRMVEGWVDLVGWLHA